MTPPLLLWRGLTDILHGELDPLTSSNCVLELLVSKSRLHPVLDEAVDLLWGAADEASGVEQGVEVGDDRLKVRVGPDAVEQIILKTEALDLVSGFVGEDLHNEQP